jgi:hypothetical protein
VPRKPVPPLTPGWVIVDGLPVFHRSCLDAGSDADAMVHVHDLETRGPTWSPRIGRGGALGCRQLAKALTLTRSLSTAPTSRWPTADQPRRQAVSARSASSALASSRSHCLLARPAAACDRTFDATACARFPAVLDPIPQLRPSGVARSPDPPAGCGDLADRLGQQPGVGQIRRVRLQKRRLSPTRPRPWSSAGCAESFSDSDRG